MSKLLAFYRVFQAGQSVADPVLWKSRQITGSAIAMLLASLVALAKVFGYEIPISDEALLQIGGAIIAVLGLFNSGITVASTDKIGLPITADRTGIKDIPSESTMPSLPPQFDAAVPPVGDPRYECLAGLNTDYAA